MPTFDLTTIEASPEAYLGAVVDNPKDVATPVLLKTTRSPEDLAMYLADLPDEKRRIVEGNVAYSEEIGAKIGLILIGRGADRTVFHDLETDTVHKIADRSKDPIGDFEIERTELAICQEYYVGLTVPTTLDLILRKTGDLMLTSTQPFIELWEDTDRKHDKKSKPPEIPDEIIEAAERLHTDRGLSLDGSALQPGRDGQFWILETTLSPFGIFLGENDSKGKNWKLKSWRPFDIRESDLPIVTYSTNSINVGRIKPTS
jgi:hypothetical protein